MLCQSSIAEHLKKPTKSDTVIEHNPCTGPELSTSAFRNILALSKPDAEQIEEKRRKNFPDHWINAPKCTVVNTMPLISSEKVDTMTNNPTADVQPKAMSNSFDDRKKASNIRRRKHRYPDLAKKNPIWNPNYVPSDNESDGKK